MAMSGLSSRNTGAGRDWDRDSSSSSRDPESQAHSDFSLSSPSFSSPSFSCSSLSCSSGPGQACRERDSRAGGGVLLLLLVAGWYLCAIACITSSKRSLQACPFPCLLSLAQFSVSCGALWVLRLSGLAAVVQQSAATGRSLDKEEKVLLGRLVVAVGLSYCAGFLFTNLSFSLISANFAETIKSGEPITSVLLGYIVLKQSYAPFSYGCLTLICFGVGLSCVGVDEFSIWGFLAAVISNFCFSYRAVLAKQLSVQFPGEVDELTLFYHISTTGCALMLPLTIIMEGRGIFSLLTRHGDSEMSGAMLLLLLIFNGITYCAYNVLSFFVLYRTDLIIHAILNVCRRMTIIVFTACFFQVHVTPLNALGVALALCGVLLFSMKK